MEENIKILAPALPDAKPDAPVAMVNPDAQTVRKPNGLEMGDYVMKGVACRENAYKLTYYVYNLRLESVKNARKLALITDEISVVRNKTTYDVASEVTEDGKPKYKNELTRKAEIEIRLKPLLAKMQGGRDALVDVQDGRRALLEYAQNLLRAEIAFAAEPGLPLTEDKPKSTAEIVEAEINK